MKEKKCGLCQGFGFWSWGDFVPMGEMDADDGFPTKACPECGASKNPIEEYLDDDEEEQKE